jgi:hypothetical protein
MTAEKLHSEVSAWIWQRINAGEDGITAVEDGVIVLARAMFMVLLDLENNDVRVALMQHVSDGLWESVTGDKKKPDDTKH